MNKQDKINAIYEKIANKELNKWCVVNDTDYNTWKAEIFAEYWSRNWIMLRQEDLSKPYIERKTDVEDWEIIWHSVLIWDVLDYLWEQINPARGTAFDFISKILLKWEKKRLSIQDQSEECIDYIYNLIKE